MSYAYSNVKPTLFTDDGQRLFLKIRDKANSLLKQSGAVRMQELMSFSGSTWDMLACVDRMVELGELREITNGNVAGQYRVFVGTKEL